MSGRVSWLNFGGTLIRCKSVAISAVDGLISGHVVGVKLCGVKCT